MFRGFCLHVHDIKLHHGINEGVVKQLVWVLHTIWEQQKSDTRHNRLIIRSNVFTTV